MNSNAHIVNLSAYEQPEIVESNRNDWVLYGTDNEYFDFLIDNYLNSSTNNAIINNIGRLAYGKGLTALDAAKKPNEYAQSIMLFDSEDLKKVILDFKMLGQAAFQIHYSKDHKKIVKAMHIPVQLIAPEKCNKEGNIDAYYYSDNWKETKKFPPKRIPYFGTSKEQIEILCLKNYTPSMKYFAAVDYVGALSYCTLEQEISDFLINDVQNSFSSTKIVNFNNGVPTEEQQSIISSRVMDKLTGANGQKLIVSFNADEASKTTIDDIQLNNAPEHYQYLSDECSRKIMVGHNVTSPLLFGIASKNGFSSNADELKDSSIIFDNMVIKPIQNQIIDALKKILAFNKVSLKLRFEELQPLSPSGDLTKTDQAEDIINGINSLSPLVANKVLENMSPEEIRSLVGLKGVKTPVIIEEQLKCSSENDKVLTEEQKNYLLDNLEGEMIDEEVWELVDSRAVQDDNESIEKWANKLIKPNKSSLTKLADFIKSYPNKKSSLDKDIYKVRYSYERISKPTKGGGESRDFCKKMEARTASGVRYRKEDIDQASFQGVNNSFGHKGMNYSLFRFKGGIYCYHYWQENLYRLKQKTDGTYYKDKALSSSEEVFEVPYIVNPKHKEEAAIAPITMPDEGAYK
tara:strand:+ start:28949 stop:30841 length:1893 start_codon:yes stop_codon:yes gene_type:complete